MYSRCRWCRHRSKDNSCKYVNEAISVSDSPYKLSEDGVIAGAVEEAIEFPKMDGVESLLDSFKISAKRKTEILKAITEELEDYKVNLVEDIDYSIGKVLMENPVESNLEIVDIEGFCCKYFE